MNKGDFVGGMLIVSKTTGQVMTLGGTPDDWTGSYVENGTTITVKVKPGDVDPANHR